MIEKDRFNHLTGRQKSACYFIMSTLGVYLEDNETPEEFLNKYLVRAKIKAGWSDPHRKASGYSVPLLSLEDINKYGVSIEEDFELALIEYMCEC
nr:MAG TPA: hypothetical protein [Caudoviricetes sp.]